MIRCLLAASILLLLAGCQSTGPQPMLVQGILGANALGGGDLDFKDVSSEYEGEPDSDLSTAPMIGFAAQQPMVGKNQFQGGFEGGMLLSWWRDGVDTYGAAGGRGAVVVIDSDTRMWVADLFLGVFGAVTVSEQVRLYAGVGPTLNWAGLDYETDLERASGEIDSIDGFDSDWSWGVYARGGVEYQMDKANLVGLGVRYQETDFRFGEVDTEFDLGVWQLFVTFSTSF